MTPPAPFASVSIGTFRRPILTRGSRGEGVRWRRRRLSAPYNRSGAVFPGMGTCDKDGEQNTKEIKQMDKRLRFLSVFVCHSDSHRIVERSCCRR